MKDRPRLNNNPRTLFHTPWVCVAFVLIAGSAVAAEPAYKVLGCDNGKVAVVGPDGKVEWEMPLKFGGAHEVWQLAIGNNLAAAQVLGLPDKSFR